VASSTDVVGQPKVFRLFMHRGQPRQVVKAVGIESVWRNERGILCWIEGGYPPLSEPLRKGGNAFIPGDAELTLDDAWWMGREQTDLRILLHRDGESVLVSALWARGQHWPCRRHETGGEVLPVRLLIDGLVTTHGTESLLSRVPQRWHAPCLPSR
jgi:hypothetical protein